MSDNMTKSYNRERGDTTGGVFNGRVDVYYDGDTEVDQWGRLSVRSETHWTGFGDGDTTRMAEEIAAKVGGEIRTEYFDPHCNGGRGYKWVAGHGMSIVVVPPEK